MSLLRAIWTFVIGLFVDDLWFTAAVLGWLGITCAVLPRTGVSRSLLAMLLLAGMAALLVMGTIVKARGLRRRCATKP